MARTVARREYAEFDPLVLLPVVREFAGLDRNIKTLTSRKTELRNVLAAAVEENGEADDKGHLWLPLPESMEGITQLKRERRVSQHLDEERAETLLASKGLTERCYKLVPVLDEDEVLAAHFEGLLTEVELDSMFPKVVSFAFVPVRSK